MNKNNKEENGEKLTSTGIKLFVSVNSSLNREIRMFRHLIMSGKFNSAMVELLKLGLKYAEKEPGVIDELKKKFLKENED